jgi:hypothetical protein
MVSGGIPPAPNASVAVVARINPHQFPQVVKNGHVQSLQTDIHVS